MIKAVYRWTSPHAPTLPPWEWPGDGPRFARPPYGYSSAESSKKGGLRFACPPYRVASILWIGLLVALLIGGCAARRPAPLSLPEPQPLPEQAAFLAENLRPPPPEVEEAYGLLYFSGGQGTRIATALALNRLYEDAIPGYGLYTFVLPGVNSTRHPALDQMRQRELLRLIETYAAGSGEEGEGLRPDSHVFLVPVRAQSLDEPLAELVATELAGLMRLEFAGFLRQRGQRQWASRLERTPGPFLISAPEPRLVPRAGGMPRLLVDLSGLGPETLYELIDRYDQDLPRGLGGRPEALSALRKRLATLPTWGQISAQVRLITP